MISKAETITATVALALAMGVTGTPGTNSSNSVTTYPMIEQYGMNSTLMTKSMQLRGKSNVEQAEELFRTEMREFTKEEAALYNEALEELFEPIGVNVFDLC